MVNLDLSDSIASVEICNYQCGGKLYYSAEYEYICIYCVAATYLVTSLPKSTYYPIICFSWINNPLGIRKTKNIKTNIVLDILNF